MEFKYEGNSLKSGVYKITNTVTGKVYIGSAKSFKKRGYQHLRSLEKGIHQNKHLQHAFNIDGTNAFVFEVLEIVDGTQTDRLTVEQKYLDTFLENWELCYNFKQKTVAKDRSCWSHTPEETSKKMSESQTRAWNDLRRLNVSNTLKQLWSNDAEYRVKMAKRIGISHTTEIKQAISKARLGMRFSPEHCDNISRAKLGTTAWNKNTNKSGMSGRKHSEETKRRMAESAKKRHGVRCS